MRDLSHILGDPTESLAAEAVFALRWDEGGGLPTWGELADDLTERFSTVHCRKDAEQRILAAWAAGEIVETLDDDFNPVFNLDPALGKRTAARYAYLRLQEAAERGSEEVDLILSDENRAHHFVETFAAPEADNLAADLDISRTEALKILYADPDEHSAAIRCEPFTLAKWLHKYLTEQNASG